MKQFLDACPILVVAFAARALAASLPAEQLFPSDTIALFSVPDYPRLAAAQRDTPTAKFWKDEAMARFRSAFNERFNNKYLGPLERELGVKAKDVLTLLQGQIALGITQTRWDDTTRFMPSMTLVVDTREKAEQLKNTLAAVRTRLTESGRAIRTDRIRDVEVVTVQIKASQSGATSDVSTDKGGPDSTGAKSPTPDSQSGNAAGIKTLELSFCHVDSLLLVSTCQQDLEKVIAKLQGASVPTVSEKPGFETARRVVPRDALAFGWTDMSGLYQLFTKAVAKAAEEQGSGKSGPTQVERLFPAIGLAGLKSMAFAMRHSADGTFLDLFVGVPQEERKGLFKLLSIEQKDASPPPWIPSDAVQFSRSRIDGQKAWAALESTINEISPSVLDFLIGQLNEAMKTKDPGFDFRQYFVQNLGDDMVSYQRPPRDSTPEALSSPPTINLISSPKPEQMLAGIKAALLLMPPPLNNIEFKEREFLGKRIYSVVPPSVAFLGAESASSTAGLLHISAANGYLALASDITVLEEFLRSAESRAKSLSELPGWNEALQLVGGAGGGFLGYQNEAETIRALFARLKSSDGKAVLPLSIGPLSLQSSEAERALESLADFSLLPPFESVSEYFGMFICSGAMTPEGYTLRAVFPTPPQVRQ
ncbi:MAG: hypothetical protein GX456_09810 [Verrucomicrobia bacterium]|nr:hypothetical protein [Verrucomicrobiota bacterium]